MTIDYGTAGLLDRSNSRGKEIWPVYRTSPYRAEAERLAGGSSIAQILFVDEGQQCRCPTSALRPFHLHSWKTMRLSSTVWGLCERQRHVAIHEKPGKL